LPAAGKKISSVAKQHEEIRPPKENKKQTVSPNATPAASGLTAEENAILHQRVPLDPLREPSEDEMKVLQNIAAFQTGQVEKLPSQAWALVTYKQLITEQEKTYQV